MGQSAIKNPRRIVVLPGGGGTDPALEARVEYLEDNTYKITYFAEINGTTGTITKPTNSTILTDQFFGGVDAYVSTIQNGQPTGIFPQTAGGVAVDVTSFNTAGDFVLNGTPSAYPVALIYKLSIAAINWQNLDQDYVLDMGITETPYNANQATVDAGTNDDQFVTSKTFNDSAQLAAKAPLASPTFTGNPQAPTPATNDNDQSIATTEFVQNQIAVSGVSNRLFNYYNFI